jgi:transposase InsO family protein
MILKRENHLMNLKKIRRLMKKYGLFCSIRKPNPYKKMMKELEEATIASNVLERKFREYGPRVVLLTDITYLFYGNHLKCYLSSIKDAYTKEILAWVLSANMEEDFVLETINMLLRNHKDELKTDSLVHSDQGIHYRVLLFQELLKNNNLRQSMSRKANCWDNAPQESFHGHMKDEIDLKSCKTFEEVQNLINNYIYYYNNERPQWGLAKLTPTEYYQFSITGIYSISKKDVNRNDNIL